MEPIEKYLLAFTASLIAGIVILLLDRAMAQKHQSHAKVLNFKYFPYQVVPGCGTATIVPAEFQITVKLEKIAQLETPELMKLVVEEDLFFRYAKKDQPVIGEMVSVMIYKGWIFSSRRRWKIALLNT